MSTRTIAVAVAAVAVAAAAAGCLHDGEDASAKLQALEADPMATYEPPGAELVDTDAQSEGTTALGKPQPARHTRLFALAGDGERCSSTSASCAKASIRPRYGSRSSISSDEARYAGFFGGCFFAPAARGSPARKRPVAALNASEVFSPGSPSTLTKIPGSVFRNSCSSVACGILAFA